MSQVDLPRYRCYAVSGLSRYRRHQLRCTSPRECTHFLIWTRSLCHDQIDNMELSTTLISQRAFHVPNGLLQASHSVNPGIVGLLWVPEYAKRVTTTTNCTYSQFDRI